jgi:YtcA family
MRNVPKRTRKVASPSSHGGAVATTSGVCLLGTMLLYAGCSRAPSFNILGSFFPSWILCGIVGLLLTVGMRWVFLRVKLEQQLSPLILVYPCLTAFFTFTLWLIFFR